MPDTDFEPQLHALLTRAASDIGPDADIAPRVRARLAHSSRLPITIRAIRQPRRLGAALSAGAIAALLLAVLLVLGPGLRGHQNPTSTATATVAPFRASDVTLTYDSSYADAAHTIVQFHLKLDVPLPFGYSIAPMDAILKDAHGHTYPTLFSDQPNSPADTPGDTLYALLFAPLPASEMGSAQTLVFQESRVFYSYAPPPPQATGHTLTGSVTGSWKLSFDLRPSRGTDIALHDPAQTHDGITVQPLSLEVASQGDPDGLEGAARIVVRVSGLPADEPAAAVANFDVALFYPNGGGYDVGGGAKVLLTPLGDKAQKPGFVLAIGADGVALPLESSQPVGASGTVELEMLFFGPLQATKFTSGIESGALTFETINVGPQAQQIAISGPWDFEIPIRDLPLK